jgi:hypothetical protein
MHLTSTSDLIRVVTSAAADVEVHASWADLAAGVVTPGRTNTASITTATTTTVVGSPVASTVRRVKLLFINNAHASTSTDVTVEHTDGTNAERLSKVALLAGESLNFVEGAGFVHLDANGLPKDPLEPRSSASAITAQIAAFSVDTYIGANLNVAGRLQAGSFFRWFIIASKGAAGTAAPTFILRTGTAGAIGDAARLTMTGPAQTAAADTARIEVVATFRAVGAEAVIRGDVQLSHNLAATGFAATGPAGEAHFGGTSASFDSSPAGTILGLSINPGASGAWVVEQATLIASGLLP